MTPNGCSNGGAAMRCPGCRSPCCCWLGPCASLLARRRGSRARGPAVGPACPRAIRQPGFVWLWVSHASAETEVGRQESGRAAVLQGAAVAGGDGEGVCGATQLCSAAVATGRAGSPPPRPSPPLLPVRTARAACGWLTRKRCLSPGFGRAAAERGRRLGVSGGCCGSPDLLLPRWWFPTGPRRPAASRNPRCSAADAARSSQPALSPSQPAPLGFFVVFPWGSCERAGQKASPLPALLLLLVSAASQASSGKRRCLCLTSGTGAFSMATRRAAGRMRPAGMLCWGALGARQGGLGQQSWGSGGAGKGPHGRLNVSSAGVQTTAGCLASVGRKGSGWAPRVLPAEGLRGASWPRPALASAPPVAATFQREHPGCKRAVSRWKGTSSCWSALTCGKT